ARIAAWDMPQLGVLHVRALGEQRFRILERRVQANGLTLGTIELIAHEADESVPQNCAGCVKLLAGDRAAVRPLRTAASARLILLGQLAPRRAPPAPAPGEAGAPRARQRSHPHRAP